MKLNKVMKELGTERNSETITPNRTCNKKANPIINKAIMMVKLTMRPLALSKVP
eukprot:CAMPEP_0204281784 /NCGR_PEP_ID=MMETSP0468-20130131/41829_1 /ASSEMBLY_ACC=CAM_ASM_000383 /TAXON_ID=2969 /ORGANISM="Oxyrrhis marina" /LENGTH=53 /DNA_ID=CAMNT_0051259187 /DNA_START=57 /DNA_END=214 /DNA_ORIENTATION=-